MARQTVRCVVFLWIKWPLVSMCTAWEGPSAPKFHFYKMAWLVELAANASKEARTNMCCALDAQKTRAEVGLSHWCTCYINRHRPRVCWYVASTSVEIYQHRGACMLKLLSLLLKWIKRVRKKICYCFWILQTKPLEWFFGFVVHMVRKLFCRGLLGIKTQERSQSFRDVQRIWHKFLILREVTHHFDFRNPTFNG